MLLMIDNYDSFTYNLVQYFAELGEDVVVHRNDQVTVEQIKTFKPERIVISPGPCTPNEAGVSLAVIESFQETLPILGVCLGHQSIAQAFGATVGRASTVMHGKTSQVYHSQRNLFQGLPSPFEATRYHSLVVKQGTLPDCFELTAWTQQEDGQVDEIMGFAHRSLPLFGVQFHPESILTQHGQALRENFLAV